MERALDNLAWRSLAAVLDKSLCQRRAGGRLSDPCVCHFHGRVSESLADGTALSWGSDSIGAPFFISTFSFSSSVSQAGLPHSTGLLCTRAEISVHFGKCQSEFLPFSTFVRVCRAIL